MPKHLCIESILLVLFNLSFMSYLGHDEFFFFFKSRVQKGSSISEFHFKRVDFFKILIIKWID